MATAMLQGLGDPLATRGTIAVRNQRLIMLLAACATELILLDDFHHLIAPDTQHVLRQVGEWLKVIIKTSRVPVVVVSIPHRATRILDHNPQLGRLFRIRKSLEPLGWDQQQPLTNSFAVFVQRAEVAVGLPLRDPRGRQHLLELLYQTTRGNIANLMALLRAATDIAELQGDGELHLGHFASACEMLVISQPLPAKRNPFGKPIHTG